MSWGAALLGVLQQVSHQRRRDRLPANGFALLPQADEALVGVEVSALQRERAAAPARGLGVQAQQQRVECRIVPGRRRNVVDLGKAGVGDRAAGRRKPSRFGDLACRVVTGGDVAVVLGVPVQAAQAAMRCSAAPRPPRPVRRATTLILMCSASWRISDGVGSSSRRVPQCSMIRFQYEPYTRRVPLDTAASTMGM